MLPLGRVLPGKRDRQGVALWLGVYDVRPLYAGRCRVDERRLDLEYGRRLAGSSGGDSPEVWAATRLKYERRPAWGVSGDRR